MNTTLVPGPLRRLGLGLLLGAALALASCGGSDDSADASAPPSTFDPAAPSTVAAPIVASQPLATAQGTATGAASTATIGAAGGRLSSSDGKVVLTIPAGALASDTVISIEPQTNLAHGGIGSAYRLAPEGQTFLKHVTLAFAYTDQDVQGSAAAALGAAFQTGTGHWQWAGDPTLDVAARTVSVATTHFSTWSAVKGAQLLPVSKTVKVKATVALQAVVCYTPAEQNGLASLGYRCDGNGETVPLVAARDWSVNGRPGGGAYGTVSGDGLSATYTAPEFEPTPNTVAVSAQVDWKPKGSVAVLISHITVVGGDSWTGTASFRDRENSAQAQVTWILLVRDNNIAQYTPTGTGTIESKERQCSYPATSGALAGSGILIVDYNTSPPTYRGLAATGVWSVTKTCVNSDGISVDVVPAGLPYFGGSKGSSGTDAEGTVTVPLRADEPMTIEGSDTDGMDGTFTWKFTRNP